jgi:hypothetical protein
MQSSQSVDYASALPAFRARVKYRRARGDSLHLEPNCPADAAMLIGGCYPPNLVFVSSFRAGIFPLGPAVSIMHKFHSPNFINRSRSGTYPQFVGVDSDEAQVFAQLAANVSIGLLANVKQIRNDDSWIIRESSFHLEECTCTRVRVSGNIQ